MADKTIQERSQRVTKRLSHFGRNCLNLGHRLRQTMRDLNVFAAELSQQLHVMIARDTDPCTELNHVTDQAERVEDSRAAINKVSDKDGLTTGRMLIDDIAPPWSWISNGLPDIPELSEQLFQFIGTAMDITNDIEGTMFIPAIIPERNPFDGG